MTKRSKALLAYARELGYEVVRRTGSGHLLVRHAVTRATVTIATTPGDWHGDINTRKRLWRGAHDGEGH